MTTDLREDGPRQAGRCSAEGHGVESCLFKMTATSHGDYLNFNENLSFFQMKNSVALATVHLLHSHM